MKEVTLLVGALALALAATATAVLVGRDSTILVPPPEAVVEQFVRQVAARRYDRAVEYVEPSSGVSPTTIRLWGDRLHGRAGDIDQVEGEPGAITGDTSTAGARITASKAGELEVRFALVRRDGLWRIADWEDAE